jgi:two-component system response regulator HydG
LEGLLEKVVVRAVALAEETLVQPGDLPQAVRERRMTAEDDLSAAVARGLTLEELEREYIKRVLAAESGNKTRAAQRLGLDRKTLYRKLEEYEQPPGGGGEGAR